VLVSLSNMISEFLISLPDTPKWSDFPSTWRAYTMPV